MEHCTHKILKVVTIDDSFVVSERLKSLLNEIEDVEILGSANTISSARKLTNKVNPDVIILDINLSDTENKQNGIDLLDEFRRHLPESKIIIFTNHNELHYRLACYGKGASCFFDKSTESHKISEVIKQWIIKN